MAEHGDEGVAGAETHGRMLRALRSAVTRAGGARGVSGLSLVAALCASAVVPAALVGPVIGTTWDAWLATVGSIGSNVLADVIISVVGRRRSDLAGDSAAVELALAAELETRMAAPGPDAAELRGAVAAVLQERGAQQVLAQALAEGDGELRRELAASMAVLAKQFAVFAFVGEGTRRAVLEINASLQEQHALLRTQGEHLREQRLMLLQVLETMRSADHESADGSGGEAAWPGCPYMGLLPFGHREARIFYGRKNLTSRLCQALAERLGGGGLLVVTGASGAGKSSLLSAGLLPALSRDVLAPGSGRWPCRVLTPTAAPLDELAARLAALSGKEPREVSASLTLNPARAADLAAEAVSASVRGSAAAVGDAAAAAPRLVLIVDQFEELFTRTPSDDVGLAQRTAFVEALDAAATVPVGPAGRPAALVVVAIRGDFLEQAFDYRALQRAGGGAFVVGAMTEAELRSTITGPAAEARLEVESALVDEIMRQLRRRPGSAEVGRTLLPLVSEVMAATWENREGTRLTQRAYERAGGVSDAVNNGAHSAYESLQERLRPIARALFLRLTLVRRDGRVVRRRASRVELYRATGHPQQDVDAVIEVFAARRLLVLERDEVEIPHDALLASWSDLQGWLNEVRDERVIYGRLSTDAQFWREHRRDSAYLYRGGRLAEITEAQKRWEADPQRPMSSPAVTEFLAESEKAQRKRTSRRRRAVAGLAALTVLAVAAAAGAGVAAQRARHDEAAVRAETSVAVSRQLAVEALRLDPTDPYTARQLAAAAWSVAGTAQAGQTEAALLDEQRGTIITPDRPIFSVAFSPDGTMVATVGRDGSVRLWDPVNQRQLGAAIPAARNAAVSHVLFSPDGKLLADGSDKGVVSLWSVTTHRQVGTAISATGNGADVLGLAFNASGTLLATAGGDGTARLWDSVSGRPVGAAIAVTGDGAAVSSVAFSPDGALLATGDDDGNVRLWDVVTHRQAGRTVAAATRGGVGVVFNPQGTLFATAGIDGSVRLWDAATQNPVGTPIQATSGFTALGGFNPAGTLLATGGVDGTVRLWDPATQHQVGASINATGDKSIVWSVAFNPSGTLLATAGGDGVVRLWNPGTQQQVASSITAAGNRSAVSDVAFDPSGKLLATAGDDGNVRLWDPVSQQQFGHDMAAAGDDGPATSVAFSPSGALLATAGGDGSVRLWDPVTQRQAGAAVPVAPRGRVVSVAFARSGTGLATGDDHGIVRLWDAGTRRQIGRDIPATADGRPATSVAFSPSSALLATAGGDGSVRLWNAATQHQVGTAIDVHAAVSHLAFSPSGALLATADSDGSVRLFNTATQHQVGPAITPGSSIVWDVAFGPRGDILATADAQGAVRFWNPATGQPLGVGNGTTGHGGGAVLKMAFNPQGTVLATANGDGTSTLIDVGQQTDPHRFLCDEFGLPSAATWSRYAENSVTEPNTC